MCWILSGRVLAHQPIYVTPTHIFVPYLYTPLYYYVGATLCRITGFGFTPLRWLSIACTAGCLVLIFQQTRELASSARTGLLAAGCFAGLYAAAGGCYDLARVDMLYLLLVLAAMYALWRDQTLLAGLLFACAYQSKQGAAIIALCVFAGAWRRPRQCVTGLVAFLIAAAGSALWLNHASAGWYAFYTRWLPAHQPLEPRSIFFFFARDLGRYLLPGLLLMAWSVRSHVRDLWETRRGNFLLSCALGTFFTALAGRIHSGGAANATVPLYAWLAVLFALAVHQQLAAPGWDQAEPRAGVGVIALAVLQFLVILSLPSRFIPPRQAYRQAQQLLDQIAAVPGDIYVVNGAIDLVPAHKTSFANGVTVWDVVRAGDSPASRAMVADIQASLRQRKYAALIAPFPLDSKTPFVGEIPNLSTYYQVDVPPLRNGQVAHSLEAIQTPGIGPNYLMPVR